MPGEAALTLDRVLYLFHLSTFAYLSGLFVRRTVERDGPRKVVVRRTTLLLWLYLLWTVIQGSVRVAASSVSNTAITVQDVLRVWIPEGQLWFLPWLVAVALFMENLDATGVFFDLRSRQERTTENEEIDSSLEAIYRPASAAAGAEAPAASPGAER